MIKLLFVGLIGLAYAQLPTNYEYYTNDGITSGLSADQPYFTLNGKNITIYSGTMHYFRVPRAYWRDRLRKMRAAGLNAVESYIPWNLHEYQDGLYDFGGGFSDMEDFLYLEEFLKTAQEEDLFVISRPGPYICAEWEFGGFPSWLLRNSSIQLRTSNELYMSYVSRYFNIVLKILEPYQFTKGGPIIMFQVENEYASTSTSTFKPDKEYLRQLRDLMKNNKIVELLVTSDSASNGDIGSLDEFLLTANFGSNPEPSFKNLKKIQPDKPTMAMEFWTGWFDHWSEDHHTRDNADFKDNFERILKYPASVNQYMFHGGTNFGFLNGANLESSVDNSQYEPTTSSYDYDPPLAENGDYTEKYEIVKELIEKYSSIKTKLPERPELIPRNNYSEITINEQILLTEIIENSEKFEEENLIPMELLPINNQSGQSYGSIVYRKQLDIPKNAVLKIGGHTSDSFLILVNGVLLNKAPFTASDLNDFGFWRLKDSEIELTSVDLANATLDIVVSNMGRGNFGSINQFNQYKGLWQAPVYLNNEELQNWSIVPLEFKKNWVYGLVGWKKVNSTNAPALYRASLNLTEVNGDTYVDMREWTKGLVIVNGFVLSRHFTIGPQQTAYLPAPLLKVGENTIIIFEEFNAANTIKFSSEPIFNTRKCIS